MIRAIRQALQRSPFMLGACVTLLLVSQLGLTPDARNNGVLPTGSVSYVEMQDVSADNRLLGFDGTAPGDVEEIALGAGLEMGSANTLSAVSATSAVAGINKLQPHDFANMVAAGSGTGYIITNIAAATGEITARRVPVDFSNYTECRGTTVVFTQANAGAKMCWQISVDGESTWTFLDGSADGDCGAETPQTDISSTGAKASAYMTLGASQRAVGVIRPLTDDGDATADPQFTRFGLQCR